MIQEGLVNLLANDTDVSGIVGKPRTDGTSGIFQGQMPKEAPLPAVVYTVVHAQDEMTMDGPDAFTMTRMQFSSYAGSYADSVHLSRAVRQALENFQGILSDGSDVDSIHRIGETDAFDYEPFTFVTHLDVMVAFRDQGT
jgi:hypothetical protein